jgi:hypothetical protein
MKIKIYRKFDYASQTWSYSLEYKEPNFRSPDGSFRCGNKYRAGMFYIEPYFRIKDRLKISITWFKQWLKEELKKNGTK